LRRDAPSAAASTAAVRAAATPATTPAGTGLAGLSGLALGAVAAARPPGTARAPGTSAAAGRSGTGLRRHVRGLRSAVIAAAGGSRAGERHGDQGDERPRRPHVRVISTGAPTGILRARRVMLRLLMRMQPWLTSVPMPGG
jgi:hypothetical protein